MDGDDDKPTRRIRPGDGDFSKRSQDEVEISPPKVSTKEEAAPPPRKKDG